MKADRDEKNEEIDHFICKRRDIQRELINKKKFKDSRREEWERLRNEILAMEESERIKTYKKNNTYEKAKADHHHHHHGEPYEDTRIPIIDRFRLL